MIPTRGKGKRGCVMVETQPLFCFARESTLQVDGRKLIRCS